MPKPLLQPSKSKNAANPNQPPPKLVDNPPAPTVAGTLANSKRQVDATAG
jgi:hypothetical protein